VTTAILIFVGIKVLDYEDYKLKMFNEFGRYILTYTKFISLLLLPVQILLTWLLFFRQFNLAKNIVFWLFLNGLQFTFKILLSPLYFIFIEQKRFLDNGISILLTFLVFWHLVLLFGRRKWVNIMLCFLIANVIFIAGYLLSGYFIIGDDFMAKVHARNIFELFLKAYQW